jgi:hypothetical protein
MEPSRLAEIRVFNELGTQLYSFMIRRDEKLTRDELKEGFDLSYLEDEYDKELSEGCQCIAYDWDDFEHFDDLGNGGW